MSKMYKTVNLSENTTVSNEDTAQKPKHSIVSNLQSAFSNITVEPILLLFIGPSMMGTLATEHLNLEKACRVNIGYDQEICDAMVLRNMSGYTAEQEIEVQKLVSSMLAVKTAIQGVVPFLLMIFLGSWSDRHCKRKPFILMPIFGEVVSVLGYILCTYFFLQLSVEYAIFFESVPTSVTGGWFCFYVGVYSYVGGKSSSETKTMRIGTAAIMTHIAITSGIALSGVTFRILGFYGVYITSITLFAISIILGFIIINEGDAETVEESEEAKKKPILFDLFDLRYMMNTFSICFKEGPNNRKKKICGIMVLVLLIVGPDRGELSIMYMFTRRKFAWDELSFSAFNTFHCMTQVLGAAVSLTIFVKWMKVDDATLGMITMASKIIGSVAYCLAPNPLCLYISAFIELFNASSHIALRSIMSKLVPVHELGQTNSVFGMCEALTPLVFGPLYSFVYNRTIAFFPGAFFLVSGGLHVVAFLIFLWIYCMHRVDTKTAIDDIQREYTKVIMLESVENEEKSTEKLKIMEDSIGTRKIRSNTPPKDANKEKAIEEAEIDSGASTKANAKDAKFIHNHKNPSYTRKSIKKCNEYTDC